MEAVSSPAGRLRALDALRSRDFRLLLAGQTVSLVGDGAFLVALGWKTFELTGSTGSLAIVLMAHGFAMLATLLIGGALADRYERRTLMIISDLARCGVIGALALTDAAGELTFPLLIVFAVGFGLGDGFFYPAFGSIVPLVVEPYQIASANTLITLSRQASFVVGPALAGVIYGLQGSSAIFGFNALTFVVAAGLLTAARPRSFEPEPSQGTLREIAAGFRYVMEVPWLWISIFVASFILMVAMAPYTALLPAFVKEEFGRGVGAYGLLFTVPTAIPADWTVNSRPGWPSGRLRSARRTRVGAASSSCASPSPSTTSACSRWPCSPTTWARCRWSRCAVRRSASASGSGRR